MAQQKTVLGMIRDVFYWSGILAAAACLTLVLSSNTAFGWRLEHAPLPLSWLLGFISIAAFIGAEVCGSRPTRSRAPIAEAEASCEIAHQEI